MLSVFVFIDLDFTCGVDYAVCSCGCLLCLIVVIWGVVSFSSVWNYSCMLDFLDFWFFRLFGFPVTCHFH